MTTSRVALVVDDELFIAEEIADFLKLEGWDVSLANSVKSAKEALNQAPQIALLISDLRMPAGQGTELLTYLACKKQDNIHFILMTGDLHAYEETTIDTGGSVTILPKPISLRQLRNIINSIDASNCEKPRCI